MIGSAVQRGRGGICCSWCGLARLRTPRLSGDCPVAVRAARAREELSQLALDAYPEAYGEFQTAMAAFLWSRGADGAPEAVRDLWAPSERTRLAETLAHALKLSVGGCQAPRTQHFCRKVQSACIG